MVYEVALELWVRDEEMLDFARERGLPVRTIISSLTAEQAQLLRSRYPAHLRDTRPVRSARTLSAPAPATEPDSAPSTPATEDSSTEATAVSRSLKVTDLPTNRGDDYGAWLRAGRTWLQSARVSGARRSPFMRSLFAAGLGWASLDRLLFDEVVEGEWLADVLARAEGLRSRLTREPDWPVAFESDELSIVLGPQGEWMTSWVGRFQSGVLVAFRPHDFECAFLRDDPDALLAVGLALSWFIDNCIKLPRTELPGLTRQPPSQAHAHRAARITYVPRPEFGDHVRQLRLGIRSAPRAHRVRGHIRTLPEGWAPDQNARDAAPAYIRTSMNERDTFVRAHSRGSGDHAGDDIVVHLSKYSCLADALGTTSRPDS